MIRKFSIALSLLVVILSAFEPSWAYDGSVHSIINEKVAKESSQLDLVLKTQLGVIEGANTLMQKDGVTKRIWQWIAYGGEAEDFGKNGENDWLSTRAYNHFHDPLEDWVDARFDNPVNINYLLCYGRHPVSSILWGLYPGMQDFSQNTTGDWSWNKARDYYYRALSGLTKRESDQNYADCFRALGQLIHLLQDVSVPAHTRNDLHIFPLYKIPFTSIELDKPFGRWTYETYTKENKDHLDYTPDQPNEFPHSDLLADPNPDPNYNNMIPVSGLFDRNMYNEGSPIPASNAAIGLAEYSNANFLSQDTIWTYQHPSLDDTNYATIDWLNPTPKIAEDGITDDRIYIKKTAGEIMDHLVAADYWYWDYVEGINMIESPFLLDNTCWKDYADKLVPRAVGYSAALLDYFFRGRMEILSLQPFTENDGLGLRLRIKNVTPTQEAMIKGDEQPFSLIYRYTPEGANPDGSEDEFVTSTYYTCREGNCDEIQYGDEVVIDFYLFWEDAMEIYKSVESQINCMLVFKGTLGLEESAVIGKNINPGKGQLESSYLPLFSDNASYGLRVKIKNVNPTQEALIKGNEDQFNLVCRYTPEGANPDGSEDVYVSSWENYFCREGNCDEIQYGDEVTIDFYFPWEEESRIGMQIYESAEDSVKCMLTFNGRIGEEETVVVGKYFTLGQDQIKFNEEWDNGLTGNNLWEHTLPDDPQNPDNGTTSNEIATTASSSNSLIKDNVRYGGYSQARFNETFIDFSDVITPYTYLQFKIDDLSITGTTTQHWQALLLDFNEGRLLQMTQTGQGLGSIGPTATYTFALGSNMNLNIFEMFQNAGISIPDPFYIESISFIQQLSQESHPPIAENSQHMEIDYIRLIEEKHEE